MRPEYPVTGQATGPAIERRLVNIQPWHLLAGGLLYTVPGDKVAVAFLDRRRVVRLDAGRNRIRPSQPGQYQIFLVDIREQSTPVRASECSADNWNVRLELEAVWRVAEPLRYSRIQNPVKRVQDVCAQALRDFIRVNHHDRLVGTPQVPPIESRPVISFVMNRLDHGRAVPGIHIERLVLTKVMGDERRLIPMQRANAEAVRFATDQAILSCYNEYEQERLAQYRNLLDLRQEVDLKEQQRIWRSEVEQGRGRVEVAKVAADEGVYIQKRRQMETETANQSAIQALEYRLAELDMSNNASVRKELAASLGAAFTAMAASPVLLSNMNPEAFNAMAETAKEVVKGLNYAPDKDHIPGYNLKRPEFPRSANGQGVKGDGYLNRPLAR